MRKLIEWFKWLFHSEAYVNKGSSQEIYQMYLNCREILSKDIVSHAEMSKALDIMRDMTTIMYTVGDGRLVEELQLLMRDYMTKEEHG